MMNLWNEINQASWTQRFVWLNVVLFVAGALVVPKLASTTFTLLALTGIVLLARERWPMDLSRAEKWLLLAFALYFIVGVASYSLGIKTRLGWEIIFRDIRFLFAIPLYLILRRYPLPRWLFWLALAIGALAAFGGALVDYLEKIGGWRASGATISIVFGHLCVAMGLLSASGAVFLHDRWQRLLLLCALVAAIIAIILSGTRGAWLALIGAGGVLLLFWWWRTGWRQRVLSIAVFIGLMVMASLFLYKPVVSRVHAGIDQWQAYRATQQQLADLDLPATGCLNQPAFLRTYAANFRRTARDMTQITVVEAKQLTTLGCPWQGAIRLHNIGDRSDWPSTPGRSISQIHNAPAHAVFWVKGRGSVQFSGTKESRTRINAKTWQRLELDFPNARWPTVLTFILGKGQTLELAPVQVTPGEYTYFYAGSSIGSRLQMWQAAWQVFLSHPLLGAGAGAWQESTAGLIEAGKISAVVARYDHAHNDYLTALADRGVGGLVGLLLIYSAPVWLFAGALRRCAPEPAAVAGLLMIGGFMLSGLTETLFNHSLVITYYAVFISLLAVMSRRPASIESG